MSEWDFANEESEFENDTDAAVATINLVGMLDPDKVDGNVVAAVSEATGADPDFVTNTVKLVEETNDVLAHHGPEVAAQHFARESELLCETFTYSPRNFAAEDKPEECRLSDISTIVGALDDDALTDKSTGEIAETISDATDVKEEVAEALVDLAKENFACGMEYHEFITHNFAAEVEEAMDDDPELEAETAHLPQDGSSGLAQNPAYEEMDEDVDFGAHEAGEAMAIQNELTFVQNVDKVPEAKSNFGRRRCFSNSVEDKQYATLKDLLGDKFVD